MSVLSLYPELRSFLVHRLRRLTMSRCFATWDPKIKPASRRVLYDKAGRIGGSAELLPLYFASSVNLPAHDAPPRASHNHAASADAAYCGGPAGPHAALSGKGMISRVVDVCAWILLGGTLVACLLVSLVISLTKHSFFVRSDCVDHYSHSVCKPTGLNVKRLVCVGVGRGR